MVNTPITIKTTGNHAFIAYKNGGSGCIHRTESGRVELEDRGTSNHGSAHTFNETIDIDVGDLYRFTLWESVFANQKEIKVYAHGKLIGTDSGTVQCATVTHTFTLADLTRSGKASEPTYLEQLDKIDQYSSAQYIPKSR